MAAEAGRVHRWAWLAGEAEVAAEPMLLPFDKKCWMCFFTRHPQFVSIRDIFAIYHSSNKEVKREESILEERKGKEKNGEERRRGEEPEDTDKREKSLALVSAINARVPKALKTCFCYLKV